MAELNEQQIDLISAYIRQHGVASDSLHEDLLDHVCTSIENLMDEGLSFEEAFAKTIKLFGPGGLKQVQQQTFELITEMNVTMKKVAFVLGLTSAILLLAGTVFKLLHWPGAGIMVVLGGGILSLGYLPMLLWHKLKESEKGDAPMHIAGFVGLAGSALGVTFKIMHWPGAGMFLIGGMAFLGIIYIPIYFFRKYKTSSNKPVTLSAGLVAMTCLIMVFALININNSAQMDRALLLPENHLYVKAQGIRDTDFAKDGEFWKAASETVTLLDEFAVEMIMRSEEVSRAEASRMSILDLRRRNDHRTPHFFLFDEGGRMSELVEVLKRVNAASEGLATEGMFAYEVDESYVLYGESLDWASYHFKNVPLTSVLSQFAQIKLDLLRASDMVAHQESIQPAASGPPSGS